MCVCVCVCVCFQSVCEAQSYVLGGRCGLVEGLGGLGGATSGGVRVCVCVCVCVCSKCL